MKTNRVLAACMAVSVLAISSLLAVAEEDDKNPLAKIKCPLSGHEVDAAAVVDHHGGSIYFCCEKCVSAFEKSPEKFATKANYQLVATGQFKQKGCPMSGGKVKDETQITVGYAELEVGFCCPNCTKKAKSQEGDDQLALIFSEKSFAKAFEAAKGEEEEQKAK